MKHIKFIIFKNMKRKYLPFLILPFIVFGFLLSIPLGVSATSENIGICHRTNAHQNPYGPKKQFVDDSSIFKNKGHDSHDGDIWFEGIDTDWGDIIEPFNYGENDEKYYEGKNWTSRGQEIWNNNCQIPELPPIEYCIWDATLLPDDPRCVVCEWDETLLADDDRCVVCPWDDTLLADDDRCVVCPWDDTLLADDDRCVVCPWDDTLLADDDRCVVCLWDDTLLAGDPECVEPGDEEPETPEDPETPEEPEEEEDEEPVVEEDTPDVLGEKDEPTEEIEEVGVVLGETGASSNIFVYIIQSVLSLSTILSGIFFSKKYIM